MNIKEIIKHFKTQAQSRFNPSPDGSREAYYNGRKDAYNDCADILERYAVKYPNGWHPASELPPVGENGNSTDLIAIDEDNEPIKVSYSKFYKCWVMTDVTAESFDKIKIKRWCYPPKEN